MTHFHCIIGKIGRRMCLNVCVQDHLLCCCLYAHCTIFLDNTGSLPVSQYAFLPFSLYLSFYTLLLCVEARSPSERCSSPDQQTRQTKYSRQWQQGTLCSPLSRCGARHCCFTANYTGEFKLLSARTHTHAPKKFTFCQNCGTHVSFTQTQR